MLKIRVIPCLLLKENGLVKTVQFKNPTYIGDPINAVRIFNTKQVDELVLLDITATADKKSPNTALVRKISDECRMPLTVGGGVRTIEDIRGLLNAGAEKVVINTWAFMDPDFIATAASEFGSQAIVVSIDVKNNRQRKNEVCTCGGTKPTGLDPLKAAQLMQEKGAGEILLNSIEQDGMMQGYDIDLIRTVADGIDIPLVAVGGAGKVADLSAAVKQGHASAVSAGSMFVFHGSRRAVLINFPTPEELAAAFDEARK